MSNLSEKILTLSNTAKMVDMAKTTLTYFRYGGIITIINLKTKE